MTYNFGMAKSPNVKKPIKTQDELYKDSKRLVGDSDKLKKDLY